MRNNLDNILNSLGDALIATDIEGRITLMNPMAQNLTSYRTSDVIGKSFKSIIYIVNSITGERYENLVEETLTKGKLNLQSYNAKLITSKHLAIPITGSLASVNNSKGSTNGVVMVFRDVGECKQAEEKPQMIEERVRGTLNAMEEGVLLIGWDWRYLFINKSAEIQSRRPAEDLLGKTVMECWPGFEKTDYFNLEQKVMQERLPEHFDGPFTFPEGETRWFHWNIQPAPEGLLIVTQDVTERKQAEAKLFDRERSYRELVQNANSAIIRWSNSGKITFFNEFAQTFFGYKTVEVLGKPVNMLVPETDSSGTDLSGLVKNIVANPEKFINVVNENICSDGRRVWMVWTNKPIFDKNGNVTEILAVGVDITERQLAEQKLRESEFELKQKNEEYAALNDEYATTIEELRQTNEELSLAKENLEMSEQSFRNMFEENQAMMWIVDSSNNDIIKVNGATANFYGYSKDELCKMNIADINVLSRDELAKRRQKTVEKKLNYIVSEHKLASGETRTVEVYPSITNYYGKKVLFVIVHDITERKQVEDKLLESEKRLSLVMEGSQLGYWDWNIETGEVHRNQRWAEMLGYTLEETQFSVKQWTDLHHPDDKDAAMKSIQEHLEGKTQAHRLEYRMRTKDGQYKWILDQAKVVVHDSNGKPLRMSGTHTDITESKQNEKLMRQWADAFENCAHGIAIGLPTSNKIMTCNQAFARLQGRSIDEIASMPILSMYAPEDRDHVMQKIMEADRMGSVRYEANMVRKDGSCYPVQMDVVSVRDDSGNILYRVATQQDITERRQAEKALRESEKRYTMLFHSNPVPIGMTSTSDYRIIDVNDAWTKLTGYTRDEAIGYTSTELGLARPNTLQEVRDILQTKNEIQQHEILLYTRTGEKRQMLVSAEPINMEGEVYFLNNLLDITERKKAEELLKKTHRTLDEAQKIAHLGSFEYDVASKTTIWSEEEYRIYGLDINQPSPEYEVMLQKCIHPDDAEMLNECFTKAMSGLTAYELEHRIIRPEGDVRWVYDRAQPYFDKNGNLERYVGITLDITERKQAEEKLRESEEQYRFLLNNTLDFIARFDQYGIMLFGTEASVKFNGYKPDELINTSAFDRIHPDDCEIVREKLKQAIQTKEDSRVEYRLNHKNNRIIWVEAYGRCVFNTNNEPEIIVVQRDITERKKAELDLENSESKFRSIAENLSDVIALTDNKGFISYISPASLSVFGYPSEEMTGKFFGEFLAPEERNRLVTIYNENIEVNETSHNLLIKAIRKNGDQFYAELSSSKILENENINGRLALIRDVTDIRLSEIRERNRSRILQMLTEEFKLDEILYEIQISIEEEAPDSICTILLADRTGKYLYSSIPNQLPDFYNQAIDGLFIGLGNGSCGTAAFTGESVFVENVLTYPYWKSFRDLAQKANIISCWSKPIVSFNGQVLGTFAIYSRKAKLPNEAEIARIDYAANLTRLAIEKKVSEEELRASEAKFKAVFENAPVGISIIDKDRNLLESNNLLAQIVNMNETSLIAGGYHNRKYIREDGGEIQISELASTRAIVENKAIHDFVNGIVLENGEIIWTQVSAAPLGLDDTRYVVITQDITKRKRAEVSLIESENRFRSLIERSTDGIVVVSGKGEIIYESPSATLLIGFAPEERMSRSAFENIHQDDLQEAYATFAQVASQPGKSVQVEYRAIRKDGSIWWAEVVATNLLHENPVQGIVINFRDITERKHAEAALAESEKRLRKVLETTSDGFWIVDSSRRFIAVNEAYCLMSGYSREEIMNMSVSDLEALENIKDTNERIRKIIRLGGDRFETQHIRKDKSIFDVEVSVNILDKEQGLMVCFCRDITERKQAEKQLSEREAELNYSQKLAQMSSWQVDLSGYELFVSKNYRKLIGIEDENFEVTFDYFINHVHPDDVGLMDIGKYNFSPGSPPAIFDFRILMPDGSIKWFQNNMVPEFREGKLVALKGTNIDITDKKNKEDEIRKMNETLEQKVIERTAELRDLYNNAPCGYHSLDINGIFELVNDTELKWLGYMREELVGKISAKDIMTEESQQIFKENYPKLIKYGSRNDLELEFIRKDGSILPVLLNATAVYNKQGDYIRSRSTMIDHTDRKKAEELLKEALSNLEIANKELEAFSYSVSHDLRAPLRAVGGFTQMLTEMYANQLDDEGKRICSTIKSSSEKMGQLIDDLLAFSRYGRSGMNPIVINMGLVVKSIIEELTNPEILKRIHITLEPLPEIKADPVLIKQVWINLISNAIKYSSRKEKAIIEISSVSTDKEVTFKIKDNGSGFKMQYVDKLFGVFQRLHKERDFEGTGIGLAIVKRIITKHGGQVWAKGQVDEGAEFYFTLPK